MVVETHFLTQWGHLSRNVIYVGAAPGQHIELLAQLFPSHDFYLYDPNEFRIEGGGNIGIYRKYFTDEEGLIFKQHLNGYYLLISDIITADYRAMTSLENEEQILRDNKLQMRWVELIRPRKVHKFITLIEYAKIQVCIPHPDLLTYRVLQWVDNDTALGPIIQHRDPSDSR